MVMGNPAYATAGVVLPPLDRTIDGSGYHYGCVDAIVDRPNRRVTLRVSAPAQTPPATIDEIVALGAQWWPLRTATPC